MDFQPQRPGPVGLHSGRHTSQIPIDENATVSSVYGLVAAEMASSERLLHDLVSSTIPAVTEISHYLSMAGGKRLRPMLTALGARAVGFEGKLERLMCVGEMLHLGSLLHDDVVDDGQERRGKPAAQKVYGNPAVILTGDYCFARGVAIAAEDGGLTAVTALAHTVTQMSEGEVLQLLNEGNLELDLDTYMSIIDKKSAALVAWCAAAGAWAKEDMEAGEALRTFGHNVGIAFQIADDVLDYVGEKRFTGKRRGKDLAQRKFTLPLLIAMDRVPSLRERLSVGNPSPERIPALIAEVRECGAADEAIRIAQERVDIAVESLSVLPLSPEREALEALAHFVVQRSR